MYNHYIEYLKNSKKDVIHSFKSIPQYQVVLEHVSYQHGQSYFELILNESIFSFEDILSFSQLNDKYGNPKKCIFKYNDKVLETSPTTLRYIYHSYLILQHYKKSNCKNIVEVGCGYGGLALAIHFFSSYFDISIENYLFIDLEQPLLLQQNYLSLHSNKISSILHYVNGNTYGKDIDVPDLFFISNYCYTEIAIEHNRYYTKHLLPKVNHGFLVWQNGGNSGSYPVKNASLILSKNVILTEEERPQTDAGYDKFMNYFVYF